MQKYKHKICKNTNIQYKTQIHICINTYKHKICVERGGKERSEIRHNHA